MAKHLLDQPIPPSGLPLEGGIILFPYDPKHDSDFHPRTLDEILKHRFQVSLLTYGFQLDPQGFVADALRCMPELVRAFSINQLQELHKLILSTTAPKLPGPHRFTHTRGEHELDCVAAAALNNLRHGITGPRALVALLCELCHDSRTPAFGDIVYVFTGGSVSEDEELPRLFTELNAEGFKHLCATWHLPPDTAEQVALAAFGQGLCGEIHKIIDARSYTLRDLAAIADFYRQHGHDLPEEFGTTLVEAAKNPSFDLLPHIQIENGRCFLGSAEKLGHFLEVRLELWRRVYTNPACKSTEFLYRELVLGSFFQRHKLEPRDLLGWNDHQLHAAIEREVGFKKVEHLNQGDAAWPTISYFDSWKSAREAEQEAAKSGQLTLLASLAADQKPNAKTKRHLVKTVDGSLKPFNEACPEVSERLEVLARTPVCPPAQLIVYPFKKSELSRPMVEAWQTARERWKTEPAIYPK